MHELTKSSERYMILTKGIKGYKAYYLKSLETANRTHENLRDTTAPTGEFKVLDKIYIDQERNLQEIVLELNAKAGLLGADYQEWRLWQKLNAHLRILKHKALKHFGKEAFCPEAMETQKPF